MNLKGKKIGVALTGSFCTYQKAFWNCKNSQMQAPKSKPSSPMPLKPLTAASERHRIL